MIEFFKGNIISQKQNEVTTHTDSDTLEPLDTTAVSEKLQFMLCSLDLND
jgi:hypothetical protein